MPRFTITSDQTGVGAAPGEATAGDPTAYVLEMPRGSAAVGVAVPAIGACFAGVLAVVALVHLSLAGFVIGGLIAAGAGLAARQGLRAASVPQLAAGPGGIYLSGLGMGPGERRAQVVPWSAVSRLVVCWALEPSGRAAYGPSRRPAIALVLEDAGPAQAPVVTPPLPEPAGLRPLAPGAVDLAALDPRALDELRRTRPDVLAMLQSARTSGTADAALRLPYQPLAKALDDGQRSELVAAVRPHAPRVEVVDGPDIDTRGPTVWVGRTTG